jgi:hypothetical protein
MAETEDNEKEYTPKPFPPEMVADVESHTVAHQVRDYLWGKGPVEHASVSSHMKRDLALKCVNFEMPDLPPQNFWRVRILADLYNLQEILDYLESLLNRQETETVDLDRSIASTITLEEIGGPAQKERALQYYEYLVSHRHAGKKVPELIDCLAALGTRARADSLMKRIDQEVKALSSREGTDPEAGVRKRDILGIADNELFFVEESNQSRARVNQLAEDNRLSELVRCYLLLTDDGGAEYFDLWVQQQLRRIAEANGTEPVVAAFRAAISDLGKRGAWDVNFCKIRGYNAVEYFLGTLTPEEAEFMEKHLGKQLDPLRLIEVPLLLEPPDDPEPPEEDEDDEEETSTA